MTRENLEKLQTIQAQIEEKKADLSLKKDNFEKSIESENSVITNLQSKETLYKQGIEVEALAEFKETKNKSLLGGVKVQVGTLLKYKADKALKWAIEHNMFLVPVSLNKKAFEKSAIDLNLDFVKTEPVNKVTFPKVIKLED